MLNVVAMRVHYRANTYELRHKISVFNFNAHDFTPDAGHLAKEQSISGLNILGLT